ncbi:MAG: YggT family protein [Chloroflexi bacterium]|nr:YggT family protein [Chloroflexota bacterium]
MMTNRGDAHSEAHVQRDVSRDSVSTGEPEQVQHYVERHQETTYTPPEPTPGELAWRRRHQLARVTQIIWLVTGILEGFLGVRFLLRLIAANPNAGFSQLIYGLTSLFLAPFFDITATPTFAGAALEVFTLIAMIVYALLAWAIVRVIWIVFDSPRRGL